MFCRYCGAELKNDSDYCPKCGSRCDSPYYPATELNRDQHLYDSGSIGWFFVGLFIPLLGIILGIVWFRKKPKCAKKALLGAFFPLILSIAIIIIMVIVEGLTPSDADGNYSYSLDKVNYYTDYGHKYYPPSGGIFVKATITITNKDSASHIYSSSDFDLISEGTTYHSKNTAYVTIAPNNSGSLTIVYEIPSSYSNASIKFTNSNLKMGNTSGDRTIAKMLNTAEIQLFSDYSSIVKLNSLHQCPLCARI